MAAAGAVQQLSVRVSQEIFPPHHSMHGTPHAVVQRLYVFDLPQGKAEVDQTDYGHPGRFNPCHIRPLAGPLQPKTPQIVAAAEALSVLLP